MNIQTAKLLAAAAGLDLWWDKAARTWTLTRPAFTSEAARYLSAGALRTVTAAQFHNLYCCPAESERDADAPAAPFPLLFPITHAMRERFKAAEYGAHEDGDQARVHGISAHDLLARNAEHSECIEVRTYLEADLLFYAAGSGVFKLATNDGDRADREALRVAGAIQWWLYPYAHSETQRKWTLGAMDDAQRETRALWESIKAEPVEPAAATVVGYVKPSPEVVETARAITRRQQNAAVYDPINNAWAGHALKLPPVTAVEVRRAVRALCVKFGKRVDGGPSMFRDVAPDTVRVRKCWVSTLGGRTVKGWARLVHDLSHIIYARRFPKDARGHGPAHAKLEREMTEHVIKAGWLDGTLRPLVKAKPTAEQRASARRVAMAERLAKWETKQKRAATAMRKLRRQLAAANRRANNKGSAL